MTAHKELVKINRERCRRMPVRPPPLFAQRGGARPSWVSTELLSKTPQPPGRVFSLGQTLPKRSTQSAHSLQSFFFSTWLKFS